MSNYVPTGLNHKDLLPRRFDSLKRILNRLFYFLLRNQNENVFVYTALSINKFIRWNLNVVPFGGKGQYLHVSHVDEHVIIKIRKQSRASLCWLLKWASPEGSEWLNYRPVDAYGGAVTHAVSYDQYGHCYVSCIMRL